MVLRERHSEHVQKLQTLCCADLPDHAVLIAMLADDAGLFVPAERLHGSVCRHGFWQRREGSLHKSSRESCLEKIEIRIVSNGRL